MRLVLVLASIASLSAPSVSAPTPRGQPVGIACSGPLVAEGRRIASKDKLSLGQAPGACFGRMQIYDGTNWEMVVIAPSKSCPGGKTLDVYGRSRAGPWYSFFERPLCGSKLSIGPKDQWGDWMLTIDGRRYHSRGQYYVPAN